MNYMINNKPKKVSYAERHGLYRNDYGPTPEFEEALSGDDEE